MAARADRILIHATPLITMDGPPRARGGAETSTFVAIDDGALALLDGRIAAAGATHEILTAWRADDVVDLSGCSVLPGFVDPHTHVLFAGSREREFEMRLAGKSYMEIAAAGGGIASSVRAFRAASDEEILRDTLARCDRMLALGTTTIEAKSGYGLSSEHELRALTLIDRVAETHPIGIVGTFLGAHDVPPEFRNDRAAYVRLVCDAMIPQVASATKARFCDVFCEKGAFTPEESRAILTTAMRHGLKPRLHADEFAPSGSSELAGELRAYSADHLMEVTEEGLAALRDGGVIAVLLPATSFSMGKQRYAPARRMAELGIPIALATDCNPGSSMTTSMPFVLTLAALELKMTLPEILHAATVNGAASLDLVDRVGRLAPGLDADLQVLGAPTPAAIIYHLGGTPPRRVMKAGRWVAEEGRRIPAA